MVKIIDVPSVPPDDDDLARAEERRQKRRTKNPGPGAERRGKKLTKATNAEVNKRVHEVAAMLCKRIRKGQIKKYMHVKYDLCGRQAEEYISRARAYLRNRAGRPKKDLIAEVYGAYEAILRDPELERADQFRVLSEIRSMMGLDAPTKFAETNADGDGPPEVIHTIVAGLSDDQLAVLRDIRRQQRAITQKTKDGS
jgi:hypothetical protein